MDTLSMEVVSGLFIFLIVFVGCILVGYYIRSRKGRSTEAKISNSNISLGVALPLEFSFYREKSTRTGLMEWLGVKEEFTLGFGYKSFDQKVYISTDSPRVVAVLKKNPELQHIIEQLLGETKKVKYIDFSDSSLRVLIAGSKSTLTENCKYILQQYGKKIETLALGFKEGFKTTPATPYDQEDKLSARKVKVLQTNYISALIAAAAQIFYTAVINESDYIPTDSYNFKAIAYVAVALFFIFFISSVVWGGGTRRTHRIVAYNFYFGLVLAALLSFNTYNALNVLLDGSEPVVYQVDYTSSMRRGSKSSSYYLHIENTRITSGNEATLTPYGNLSGGKTVRIGGRSYSRIKNQKEMELTVKAGFFRQPYIVHV